MMTPIHQQLVLDNIYMSRSAVVKILMCVKEGRRVGIGGDEQVTCELDNFQNLLENVLERADEPKTGNFDLIGG